MAEELFVVFGQSVGNKSNPKNNQPKHGVTEYLANPEECKFVQLSAENLVEAQKGVFRFFQCDETQTPIVVKKAAWEKTSGGGSTEYFVLFTQQDMGRRFPQAPQEAAKWEKVELLGNPFEANFIKIEGAGEEEVKEAVMRHFAGDITTKPITVTAASWKSS